MIERPPIIIQMKAETDETYREYIFLFRAQ